MPRFEQISKCSQCKEVAQCREIIDQTQEQPWYDYLQNCYKEPLGSRLLQSLPPEYEIPFTNPAGGLNLTGEELQKLTTANIQTDPE
jgi:hypothetical protein